MVNKKDLSGIHPIFLSCFTGNFEVTLLLIESGGELEQAHNETGATPLHICAERGFNEIAELLLDTYPDMLFEKEFVDGNTPFHSACEWDQIECVRLFSNVLDSQSRINLGNNETEGLRKVVDDS